MYFNIFQWEIIGSAHARLLRATWRPHPVAMRFCLFRKQVRCWTGWYRLISVDELGVFWIFGYVQGMRLFEHRFFRAFTVGLGQSLFGAETAKWCSGRSEKWWKNFKKLTVLVKYELNLQKVANIHANCAKQCDQYMCTMWSEIDLTD